MSGIVHYIFCLGLLSTSNLPLRADIFGLDSFEQRKLQQVLYELQKLNQKIDHIAAQQQAAQKTDITIHQHASADHPALYVIQSASGQRVLQDPITPVNKAVPGMGNIPVRPSWWQRVKNAVWSTRNSDMPNPQQDGSLWEYLRSHKKEIVVKGALIAYVYVNYRLFSLGSYLQSTERWHFWRSDKPLSQLLALPPQEVARELVYEIKRRYASYNGDDKSGAFIQFMRAIEDEIESFNSYLSLANILNKIDMLERHCVSCCGRLMPRQFSPITNFVFDFIASKISIRSIFYLDDQLLNSAQDSLSRLVFLRSCFTQWLAEVKLLSLGDNESDRGQPCIS